MKRTPLKRKTRLKRRARLRPVNSKRRKARQERDFGDLAEYVRSLGCLVCNARPVDPAHVKSRGAGGHAWIDVWDGVSEPIAYAGETVGNLIPLCRTHHREQHDHGIRTFEERHGIDLAAEAKRIGACVVDSEA